MQTTTRDDAPTRHPVKTACPLWCDPSQHLIDDNETALVVVHRSRPFAAGLGSARIQQTVRRFGAHLVRSPVLIGIEPNGPIELQSRDDAAEYLKDLTRTMVALTNRVWPAGTSTLAS